MDGSADVAWALTAWPTPPCAPVLAPPSACAAFAMRAGLRWRRPRWRQRRERPAPSRRRAKRRLRSLPRRSQAARSPCRLLVSRKLSSPALRQQGWQRQWRRPSPRPFHPAPSRSDRLPGKRRRKMPASSRRTSRHRTSPRRTSIWRGGSSRPWCRYRSWYRDRPWCRFCRRRVPCRCVPCRCVLGRGVAIIRIVARGLSALSDAAALSRERLSDAACASSERRGAGALSWVRLSLLLAAVLLSTSAAKLSFPADGSESGRADLRRRVLKRCVCRYF